ncbi:hypothetical protein NIES267_22980 [Calothrix parasitica NIES-267]|uniref:Uncharacterized protein n=1 Tax=Calothrix parasitica NIES-267 TaxID=1973488 RepID=A0A1Z4LNQ8_9CYAN|nr:hypothetical protein NIES267_22980 [Calothrix parasitica NIES-267]
MNENNIPSDNFGEKLDSHLTPVDSNRELVSVTETREIPDYSQQHIDELHKKIAELKTASEKSSKKYERIIGRLRFRLSLLSSFWFITVLLLSGVFGWFGSRWYNQLQLQKQLATFSPEKVQEIDKIRTEIRQFSQTIIPQLQTEIKANQEQITKLDAKIDKNQKSTSVLVKTIQDLLNPEATETTVENQSSSTEVSPTPSPTATTINPNN